jgi:transcription elongation factor Elf1
MITFYYKEVYKMKEKCPVCDYPVDEGTTKCRNCGFADELGINRVWINAEDANYWLDTVVKPYRVQWEAKKREAELLAQIEEVKKREAELQAQIAEKETKKTPQSTPLENKDNPQTHIRKGDKRGLSMGFKPTSVTIPNGVTHIDDSAYSTSYGSLLLLPGGSLTNVSIPDSVVHIGQGAFYFNQLTSLTIPNSVVHIGDSAFSSNQLTSLTIPNSVTHIGSFAFSNNQLTSLTIPNSVTHIGDNAFNYNQLTSILIPNSITHVGDDAFGPDFSKFYNKNGRKAGIYTYHKGFFGRRWIYGVK